MRLAAIELVLSLSLADPVKAGSNIWTSIGPAGGWVQTLAINPQKPTILYMGTPGAGAFVVTVLPRLDYYLPPISKN